MAHAWQTLYTCCARSEARHTDWLAACSAAVAPAQVHLGADGSAQLLLVAKLGLKVLQPPLQLRNVGRLAVEHLPQAPDVRIDCASRLINLGPQPLARQLLPLEGFKRNYCHSLVEVIR